MIEVSSFCRSLPKSELHAHLGGSVSASTLQSIILTTSNLSSAKDKLILRLNSSLNESEARSRQILSELSSFSRQQKRIEHIGIANTSENGQNFHQICDKSAVVSSIENNSISVKSTVTERAMHSVFDHFAVLHTVLDNEASLRRAAHDVVLDFAQDRVYYLELRSAPRANLSARMSKRSYVDAIRAGIHDALVELKERSSLRSPSGSQLHEHLHRDHENHEEDVREPPEMVVRLLLSLDRSQPLEELRDTLELATELRGDAGDGAVVGVDLSGHPYRGRVEDLESVVREAKRRALPVALHLAETLESVLGAQGEAGADSEAARLLALDADRIGHATFLTRAPALADELALKSTPLEICLSSNQVLLYAVIQLQIAAIVFFINQFLLILRIFC